MDFFIGGDSKELDCCGLTFELTGRRRWDARPKAQNNADRTVAWA